MEINIDGGLDGAIKAVNRYSNLESKMIEIAKRLCEVGEPIIRGTHGNHARVWSEQTPEGYRLSAEGTDILFIEFGTGDKAGELTAWYDEIPITVRPGSWSEAHGGEYAATGGEGVGYWHFGGKEYRFTEPHPAFFDAYRAMVMELLKVVQEVLK